jgi:hypothetical protein
MVFLIVGRLKEIGGFKGRIKSWSFRSIDQLAKTGNNNNREGE